MRDPGLPHREHCWHTLDVRRAQYEQPWLEIPEGQVPQKCCKCAAWQMVPAA